MILFRVLFVGLLFAEMLYGVVAQAAEFPKTINIPKWVIRTPIHCFVGISGPSSSIENARKEAIDSAVTQIVQAMGAEYRITHKSILSGNKKQSQHELHETLMYSARWFIKSVQQHIDKSHIQQIGHKYVCFVLVNFPPEKIERLRKLSVGPKVAARIQRHTDNHLVIEVGASNGVDVVITDYAGEIVTENRHAGIIAMFAWKVPETSSRKFGGLFAKKIFLRNNTQTLEIPIPTTHSGFKSLILGSENHINIVLKGYDEVNRPISLPVINF